MLDAQGVDDTWRSVGAYGVKTGDGRIPRWWWKWSVEPDGKSVIKMNSTVLELKLRRIAYDVTNPER